MFRVVLNPPLIPPLKRTGAFSNLIRVKGGRVLNKVYALT